MTPGLQRFFIVAFSVLLFFGFPPPGSCNEFKYWFVRGVEAVYAGNPDEEVLFFSRAIQSWTPGDGNAVKAAALYRRGEAYLRRYEYEKVIADCTRALELDPQLGDAYFDRGIAYYNRGMYESAILDCTKTIGFFPKGHGAYFQRGRAFFANGKYDKAIGDLSRAIELLPDYWSACYKRGEVYSEKGEYDKALKDYLQALKLFPQHWESVGATGRVYFMEGKLEDALAQLQKALAMHETFLTYRDLILVYAEKKDARSLSSIVSQAEKFLLRVIHADPGDGEKYASLAVIYCEGKRKASGAVRLSEKALHLKPDYFSYYALGLSHLKNRNLPQALHNLENSRLLNPSDTWTLLRLGSVWKAMGNNLKARQIWEEALKVNPRHRLVLSELKKLK